jgi:hypothetical protein
MGMHRREYRRRLHAHEKFTGSDALLNLQPSSFLQLWAQRESS